MKVLALPLLAASLAAALDWHPEIFHAKRQAVTFSTILADIANITNQTTELGYSAKNLTDLTGAVQLNVLSMGVQGAINKSIVDANALAPLDDNDAIKLIMPIQALANASNVTLGYFLDKKPFFLMYNLIEIAVLPSLKLQNATSYEFSEALTSKTPAESRASSATLSQPIYDSLARVIAAYSNNGTGDPALEPASDKAGAASTHMVGYWAAGVVALVMAAML